MSRMPQATFESARCRAAPSGCESAGSLTRQPNQASTRLLVKEALVKRTLSLSTLCVIAALSVMLAQCSGSGGNASSTPPTSRPRRAHGRANGHAHRQAHADAHPRPTPTPTPRPTPTPVPTPTPTPTAVPTPTPTRRRDPRSPSTQIRSSFPASGRAVPRAPRSPQANPATPAISPERLPTRPSRRWRKARLRERLPSTRRPRTTGLRTHRSP